MAGQIIASCLEVCGLGTENHFVAFEFFFSTNDHKIPCLAPRHRTYFSSVNFLSNAGY